MGFWAFAVMAVGFSEGFDSRLGTCAFRGSVALRELGGDLN